MPNQNPEQVARDAIDAQLAASGWAVQDKTAINFNAGQGQAVREYTRPTRIPTYDSCSTVSPKQPPVSYHKCHQSTFGRVDFDNLI